ncbi:MAG: hypothetical protein ABI574_19290 [Burkholderiales bacterium]
MTPNRIRITTDGGIAEVYGDIFSDMLVEYSLALSERKKKAQEQMGAISLGGDFRRQQFSAACIEYDDAESRMGILDAIEKVFKNRTGVPVSYVQPIPNLGGSA